MPGQQRRMVADAAQRSAIDYFHWDELRTIRQHIEIGADRQIRAQHLGQHNTLAAPQRKFEHWHAHRSSDRREHILTAGLVGNREHSHDVVLVFGQQLEDVRGEIALANDGDSQRWWWCNIAVQLYMYIFIIAFYLNCLHKLI